MVFSCGLLCEGTSDYSTVGLILLKRIAQSHGHEISLIDDLSIPVNGPISKAQVKLRTAEFHKRSVDIGIYLADQDDSSDNKQQNIESWISQKSPTRLDQSVIAIAHPHMEAWLLADENTVKHILSLSHTQALPHPKMAPKPRLQMLVMDSSDAGLTVSEVRSLIASQADLSIVANKCSDFGRLDKRLGQLLNSLS